MAILITLDDVLRIKKKPIVSGVALYRCLNEFHRVFILCEDKAEAENWLVSNKISKVDNLIDKEYVQKEYGRSLLKRQVDYARSQGKVDFVVTSDTELAKDLLEEGIETLLFLHPQYIRPEFRPDMGQGVRRWADIQAEIDKQNEMYFEDKRVK